MSDVDDLKAFYDLAMKPELSLEEKRLAKIRYHQKRKRKEKLYSYPSSGKKSHNTLS
jgi:hypothetical protein